MFLSLLYLRVKVVPRDPLSLLLSLLVGSLRFMFLSLLYLRVKVVPRDPLSLLVGSLHSVRLLSKHGVLSSFEE
jgi:hypothetical protein